MLQETMIYDRSGFLIPLPKISKFYLRTQVFLMQTLDTLDAADKFLHYLHFDYFYIRNVWIQNVWTENFEKKRSKRKIFKVVMSGEETNLGKLIFKLLKWNLTV